MRPTPAAAQLRGSLTQYLTTTYAPADEDTRLALEHLLGHPESGIFNCVAAPQSMPQTALVLIRRETPADARAVRAVTAAAFAGANTRIPVEVFLDGLRACDAWLPALSLVAIGEHDEVIGHVACTHGHVDALPVLALSPLSVYPDHQRRGVGLALVHSVLGAADALGEPLVALLGSPEYYSRYGFRTSTEYGITPPDPAWGVHFQARALTAYQLGLRGAFTYAEPFDRL